jgi:serine/threonine protein phosphatase 1
MKERILIVGDIHGQYASLKTVLNYAGYTTGNKLIFLGDYINRGNESREVMDYLVDLKKEQRHIFLRGNHEDIILKLLSGDTRYWYTWLEYGQGRVCINSYGEDPDRIFYGEDSYFIKKGNFEIPLDKEETANFIRSIFPHEHIQFLKETLLTYEIENYFFAHAGIETGLPLSEQGMYSADFILWGDDDFLSDTYDYGKRIVYGHYHQQNPLIQKNKICLAIKSAVAILDITDEIIYDSLGRTFSTRNSCYIRS